MKAIVLAGGFGSRLKPLTDGCPKPLLTVAGVPMLDYTVAQLAAFGIRDITYTLSYRANDIITFCSGYTSLMQSYVIERTPLGTCGGVKAASGGAGDTFIVTSGDALNNINLAELLTVHYRSDALVTMAVTEVPDPSLYGVVTAAGDRVTGFVEKPPDDRYGNLVNCGVYALDRRALKYAPAGVFFDFSRDLFPIILQKGRLSAYRHRGYWTDIGDVRSYYTANFDMAGGGFYDSVPNRHVRPLHGADGVYRAATAEIAGAAVGSIVGERSVVRPGAAVYDCVLLDGAVADGVYAGAVIGDGFAVQAVRPRLILQNHAKSSHKFYENNSN